jgi:GT2 family glycosyltransferase
VRTVDVVILSLDRPELTVETIENVLDQDRIQAHIWVVDQGSSQETITSLRQTAMTNPQITLKELGVNIGVPAGRNAGIRAGTSPIVVSIDNDAIFHSPSDLASAVEILENKPEVAVISFRIENYFTGKLDMSSWVFPKTLLPKSHESFLGTRFTGGAYAMRRNAFEASRGYDESLFFYWEELDLAYQFIQQGFVISYEPSIVVRHKVAPEKRTNWKDKRFYYLVRNALYLDWKYFGSRSKLTTLAAGYLVKGLCNGVLSQAIAGIRDGMRMAGRLNLSDRVILSSEALAYIWQNDLKHRGNVWQRMMREVLTPLPRS